MKNKKKINWEKVFIQIDRWSAWILLFSIFLYFLTGYGLTKGLIDRDLSRNLHSDILPTLSFFFFIIHSFFAVRMSFRRWKIWDSFGKFLLPVVCVLLIVGFGYIEFFYAENIKSEVSDEEDTNIVSEESNESVSDDTDSELKVFTLEELAMYDGQDGSPAYTAVDGVVYDMSDVFEDGEHYSHYAGKELTSAFYSYHTLDEITKYPVVGEME